MSNTTIRTRIFVVLLITSAFASSIAETVVERAATASDTKSNGGKYARHIREGWTTTHNPIGAEEEERFFSIATKLKNLLQVNSAQVRAKNVKIPKKLLASVSDKDKKEMLQGVGLVLLVLAAGGAIYSVSSH
ncbi:hypothetical protein PHYPSEUDO_008215 [Phytophthora pseudosyringae]|uniref:RxLR effector protein n=1 Tax=Phytophthora pseudosyringae TaxID=221518 RepID=A0A8T1VEN8_9STRA|nr:hypothetical protein PHYPSEUDO_008215 [Phytophthora pseudosyringae]